jgi:putative ABC transport system permease protein
MLQNYFKIAWRNLSRNTGFSVINIGGLATGLACCLLIYVFIQDELSYDRFHENAGQLYRVIFSTSDDGTPTNANGSFAVGPFMKQDFPEVIEYTRLRKTGTQSLVRYGENSFYEDRFFFADSTVFDLFTFPLVNGDQATALSRPNTVVITENTAQKYFSGVNPIGKIIEADPFGNGELAEFEITGILQNIPHNSHVQFDFLASIISTDDDLSQFSGFQQVFTYLLLQAGTSEKDLEAKLTEFIHRNWTENPWYTIQLQPMTDIHLHSQFRSEIQPNGNIRYVHIFSVIAILVLLIACINFMNLMTARSVKRAREVGVRKTAGATRSELIRQFLTESVVLTLLAGVFALLLVDLFTPVFNGLTGKEIDASIFIEPRFIAGFACLIFALGLLAGAYPAFMLSRFKPVITLKGKASGYGSDSVFRKGLVVFQFAVSMALIAATAIVYSQLNYIQSKDLGYAEDQIIVMPLNNDAREGFDAFRSELLQHSGIANASTSSLVPTAGTSHNRYSIEGMDQSPSFSSYFVDEHFIDTYGIHVISGENARRNVTLEGGGDFLFSERAVQEMGFEAPEELLGRGVEFFNVSGRASGIVNDIHVYSFRDNIYASAYLITPVQFHKYISIRLNPAGIQEGLDHVSVTWQQMFPGYPFEYSFLDESFEQMHLADIRLAETITWFALLAIFIACLGLFGLSVHAAERRVKEIGIRKVLGATVSGIVSLFTRDFLVPVSLGAVLAVPAAWYFANNWLLDFAYRIDINAGPFILAGAILLFIAMATISYSSIRAATRNPVESLRSE